MAPPSPSLLHRLLAATGLRTLHAAGGRDAYLIILSRTARMFAHGVSSLLLALFFAALDPPVPDPRIGLFLTLTLLGDVVLSLLLALAADRLVGRRNVLRLGGALMVLSGSAFAACENYWVLLAAAVVGVISATGGDKGPFRAVEESMLSELVAPEGRADVLVWYVTLATLGSAAGTVMAGWMVEWLRGREGWTLLDAYHRCFWVYVAMGLANVLFGSLMSEKCELRGRKKVEEGEGENNDDDEQRETEPLLGASSSSSSSSSSSDYQQRSSDDDAVKTSKTKTSSNRWIPRISRDTLSIISVLWFLLMVDSLADGMASMSLTSYYMDQKFGLPKSWLGNVVSASYFLASVFTILGGPLSRTIGLVNTMVFTHVPSSTAVLLFPLPRSVTVTTALLLVRMALNNMDQAPRAALIAAVVRPEERTAVMGITSMLRTLASTTGPSITGLLAGSNRFWVAFVAAGALRLAYDVGLFAMFVNVKLHKHEPVQEEQIVESRATTREESVARSPEP